MHDSEETMRFYKHTIVIYSEAPSTDIAFLAQDAVDGDSICDSHATIEVKPSEMPEGVLSFFNMAESD